VVVQVKAIARESRQFNATIRSIGYRAHTVTGQEVNFIGNHTPAPNACGLLAIPPR